MGKVDELHIRLMEGMSEEQKQSFLAGLKALKMGDPTAREALRESIRRSHPEYTPSQIEVFLAGRNLGYSEPSGETGKEALRTSFKKMHPEWSDKQLDIAVNGK